MLFVWLVSLFHKGVTFLNTLSAGHLFTTTGLLIDFFMARDRAGRCRSRWIPDDASVTVEE